MHAGITVMIGWKIFSFSSRNQTRTTYLHGSLGISSPHWLRLLLQLLLISPVTLILPMIYVNHFSVNLGSYLVLRSFCDDGILQQVNDEKAHTSCLLHKSSYMISYSERYYLFCFFNVYIILCTIYVLPFHTPKYCLMFTGKADFFIIYLSLFYNKL